MLKKLMAIAIMLFLWSLPGLNVPPALAATDTDAHTNKVVEWLAVQVPAAEQVAYIKAETEIWTQALKAVDGFEGKEIWQDPQNPGQLIVVVHWASQTQWDAVSASLVQKAEQQFVKRLGKDYPLTSERRYSVVNTDSR